ncbi:hypothetical protein BDL97_09G059900 [Sphagnum fallax]|nr:hypothetical protein BDL97_09G059900 [Sphagnum fallax]
MMGVGSCRDEEEDEEADERTALEAAEKQGSVDEDVFFVTSLGKRAIGSPYQLDIPSYFLEYCASRKWELKEKMVLEGDESGMLWKVMMVLRRYKEKRRANKVRVRASLARGWKDFALQNKLNTGDSLLFTLVRLNRFVVKFFHPDGSQKKGWLCSNLQQPPAIHAHKLLLPCKNRAAEAAYFKYIEHITSDGHEYVEILDSSSGSSSSSSSSSSSDEEEINEQVGVAVGLRVDNDASRDHLQSPAAVHRTNPSRLGAAADRELVIRAHQVIYTTKRPREVTDEERAKAIVAARACARSLPNISFMLIMRCSEVYYHFHLEIPVQFLRETKLHIPTSGEISWIALVDSSNKLWQVLSKQVVECKATTEQAAVEPRGMGTLRSRPHPGRRGCLCV